MCKVFVSSGVPYRFIKIQSGGGGFLRTSECVDWGGVLSFWVGEGLRSRTCVQGVRRSKVVEMNHNDDYEGGVQDKDAGISLL